MRHPTDDELNDYHDGLLPPDERTAVEAHLAECTVCEDRSAALLELLDQLHGVPREIAPPDGLWAEVQRRMAAVPAVPASGGAGEASMDPAPDIAGEAPLVAPPIRVKDAPTIVPIASGRASAGRRAAQRWMLAAAALLLVVVSSSVTLMIVRGGGRPSADELVASRIAGSESLARFAELEAAYLRAAADLVDALERERRSIPPEIAARAEQSLLVIDEAVRETRAALANDPDNAALAELTLAAHRRKLEFLQRVRQWSTES